MSDALSDVMGAAIARDRRRLLPDLVVLTKPRVTVMVLAATLVGYYAALTAAPDYRRVVHLLVGTLLAAAGTFALNQYAERDVDARMDRTRGRPLPDGRLRPGEALTFALALTTMGLAYLAVLVGPSTAALTAATVVLYIGAYTPLKQRSAVCTLVGAVPGALPPLSGWVAARGELGAGAWVLFGILFLWQLPHTLAIARLYRDDYARAGVRVLPVVDPQGGSTERFIVSGCLGLLAVSLLPTLLGVTGALYFGGVLLLGLAFLAVGMAQALAPSTVAARRVVFASLLYLPVLFGLLALDKS